MDVEGSSSGQHFPNWEEARAHYTAHYHRACMHVIPPSFPPRLAMSPPPPNTPTSSPKKKKSKTVKTIKTVAPSTGHRRRHDSSSSPGHTYSSMYEDDDPVTPVVIKPAATAPGVVPQLPPAAPADDALSPGTAGNPIEVTSNFPTPITNQDTPKRRKKAQGLAISPTPPTSFPTLLKKIAHPRKKPGPSILDGPDRFVYVCDCSDGEGGYLAPLVPSLKRKASNSAPGPSSRPNEVIEIHTDSDTDSEIWPRFCKCASLKSFLASRADGAAEPDLNHNCTSVDVDSVPEMPGASPLA